MPWQHRYHRGRATAEGDSGAAPWADSSSAAASSREDSNRGAAEHAQLLRLPLDRLASRGSRPAGGAQTAR